MGVITGSCICFYPVWTEYSKVPIIKRNNGAKKKEVKTVSANEYSVSKTHQNIEKIFMPQTSKHTEIIEGDVNYSF